MERDNTDIALNYQPFEERMARVKRYTNWLDQRNIKYNMVRKPSWSSYATHINMRNEDALAFRLVFNMDYRD